MGDVEVCTPAKRERRSLLLRPGWTVSVGLLVALRRTLSEMVCSFEVSLAQSMNKMTDRSLLWVDGRGTKARSAASPRLYDNRVPHVSPQLAWYRCDWGAGGNVFAPHLTPREPGVPWNVAQREDAKPSYEPPPDLFAGLGAQPELDHMKRIMNRSIAPSGWKPRKTAAELGAELLPHSSRVRVTNTADKSTRPFTAGEKLAFTWDPAKHMRKSFKPPPVEELSPCAPDCCRPVPTLASGCALANLRYRAACCLEC